MSTLQISFSFIFLQISIVLSAQTTFEINREIPDAQIRVHSFLEDYDGNYLFTGEIRQNGKSSIYQLITDENGNVLDEIIEEKQDTAIVAEQLIKTQDSCYLLIGEAGAASSGIKNNFIIRKYDSAFNLILKKKYPSHGSNWAIFRPRIMKNISGNYVLYGSLSNNNEFDLEYFFFEVSEEGDSIQYKHFDGEGSYNTSYSLTHNYDSTGYFCTAKPLGPGTNAFGAIFELDQNFNLVRTLALPHGIHNDGRITRISDTTYIVSGTSIINEYKYQNNQLGVAIMDLHNDEALNFQHFGKPESTDLYAMYNSMIISENEEQIFMGGFGGYIYDSGLYGITSTYYVFVEINRNLETITEKFIQNDSYKVAFNFSATSDGGFVFMGTNHKTMGYGDDLALHIIKVDTNGEIASNNTDKAIQTTELILYPNPGNAELNVRTAVQALGGEFILYDTNGKLLQQCTINRREQEINTSKIPTGQYIWKYQKPDGTQESGIWIKQ